MRRRRDRRGILLIELMICVAMFSIGTGMLVVFDNYMRATHRAAALEGLARALDIEIERTAACLARSGASIRACRAVLGGVEAGTWSGATLEKSIRSAGAGLFEVRVRAELGGHGRPLEIVALTGGVSDG